MTQPSNDPTLPVDDEARVLARTLIRTGRSGALATNDHESGIPFSSLVAFATEMDGSPVILTSQLSVHTRLLQADPRCSLLVAVTGKGDPLAHPRLTLQATARRLNPDDAASLATRRRYLAHHPKAALYVDFPDFAFWKLDIVAASLNGGFGRAYRMRPDDLLIPMEGLNEFAEMEEGAVEHMNADHADAVALYATNLCGAPAGKWILTALDPDGAVLRAGDAIVRMNFPRRLARAEELRPMLVTLAKQARQKI